MQTPIRTEPALDVRAKSRRLSRETFTREAPDVSLPDPSAHRRKDRRGDGHPFVLPYPAAWRGSPPKSRITDRLPAEKGYLEHLLRIGGYHG